MRAYRVYWFDSDRHIEQGEWIEAADESAAIAILKDRHRGANWELWDGSKRIASSDQL